ncbi:IclR family transcriptional regulator [Devosia sp.]|uniref:IclR family transcriptional regulator n=1 Tax=Devosia sp. TaxID=1871048 RepID=UPI001AC65D00|nr:IclR family transcriptional regulator [Devosia sp.]MBN9310559.1 IclR family transcriptional regulator [Devosia sp.]
MSSIRRTIQVLDLLARKGAMTARGVSQQLTLPVGSVHRMLVDLADEQVVERNATGGWQLSYRLLEITDLQLDGVKLPRLTRPFCEAIAEQTRETVNVNVLSADGCVCIDKVRGNEGMQLDWRIGSRGPLYCGGSAKAILAFMPEAERERIIAQPRETYTRNTIVDADDLRAELARTRRRGYSIDNQEVVMGVFCVGVPIVDRTGRPVGAISISGTSPKAPGPDVQPLVDLLDEAAVSVSRRLGYTGSWPPQPLGERVALQATH